MAEINGAPVCFTQDYTYNGTSGLSAINTDLLSGTVSGWVDVSLYQSASIQIVASAGISAGAIIFEGTNDPTLASTGATFPIDEPGGSIKGSAAAVTIAASTQRVFTFRIGTKYIRCRISTAFVGGTVRALVLLSQLPYAATFVGLAQTQTLGTVSTVTTLSTLIGGGAAEDAATTANPLIAGGVVRSTTSPTTLVAGDACRLTMTTSGSAVMQPYAVPEVTFQYTATLTTTSATAIKAAGAAGIRNYLKTLHFQNSSGATATTVIVLDGATTIAQFNAPISMASPAVVTFDPPLRGTAATALNINCGAAGANVIVNAQGYQGA